MRRLAYRIVVIVLLLGLSSTASAGFWSQMKRAIGVALMPAAIVLTTGSETLWSLSPVNAVAKALGADTNLYPIESIIAREALDDDLVDVYLASRQLIRRGKRIVSAPAALAVSFDKVGVLSDRLAEELQDAEAYLRPKSRPIPHPARGYLACHFGQTTLQRARYVVDRNLVTLNGTINRLQTTKDPSSGNYAVVTGDTIVFARMPTFDVTNLWFLAHEVAHTEQYQRMGVRSFARKYVSDWDALEDQADDEADVALQSFIASGSHAC